MDRVLVFDVDGTLAPEGQLVTQEVVIKLVRIAQQYDLKLGICTGRAQPLVQYVIDMFQTEGHPLSFISCEYGVSQTWKGLNPYYHLQLLSKDRQEIVPKLNPDWALGFDTESKIYKVFGTGGIKFTSKKFPSEGQKFELVDSIQFLQALPQMGMVRMHKPRWQKRDLEKLSSFNRKHNLGEIFQTSKKQAIQSLLTKKVKLIYCGNESADEEVYELTSVTSFHIGPSQRLNSTFWVKNAPALPEVLDEFLDQIFS